MSLADLTEQDLDRLADFAAGVLDSPEAAAVAELVRADATWAAALAELTAAEPVVMAQLRSTAVDEPMPADVATRIEAALSHVGPAAARDSVVVSLEAARRRRRQGIAKLSAAAALVAIAGTLGIAALKNIGSQEAGTNSAAGGQADSAYQPQPGRGSGGAASPPTESYSQPGPFPGVSITASGTNYTAADLRLAQARGTVKTASTAPVPSLAPAVPSSQGLPALPNGLAPLADLAATDRLPACLTATVANHPGRVVSVDFARYESAPAAIIVISDASGAVVVAAGPKCGQGGADELAAQRA